MSQLLIYSEKNAKFREFQLLNAEQIFNCKTKTHLYGVFDAENNLKEFRHRPDICGSPFCPVCVEERQTRYKRAWKPNFDDDFYPRKTIRHIIATSPTFPCAELGDRIETLLKNVAVFHKNMNDNYGYAFKAVVLLELKKEPGDMYYFHLHYGVLSFVNIGRMREFWCKAWGQELVVKFPSYKGRPQYYTEKMAFCNYIAKRRAQQGLVISQFDYYFYLSRRRLLRRVGFSTQDITRIVTISRDKYSDDSDLPGDFILLFIGTLEKDANLNHFCERYRAAYYSLLCNADENFSSLGAAQRLFVDMTSKRPTNDVQLMSDAINPSETEAVIWSGPTTF